MSPAFGLSFIPILIATNRIERARARSLESLSLDTRLTMCKVKIAHTQPRGQRFSVRIRAQVAHASAFSVHSRDRLENGVRRARPLNFFLVRSRRGRRARPPVIRIGRRERAEAAYAAACSHACHTYTHTRVSPSRASPMRPPLLSTPLLSTPPAERLQPINRI